MQGQRFTVRKADAADAADAFALIEEYYEQIGVMVREDRGELQRYLGGHQSGIWLAWCKSETAGDCEHAAGCILLRPLSIAPGAGEVKRLYVRHAFRGCGVAAALLHALEKYAAAEGITSLYLDTKQDLAAAIRFYERSGYSRCDRYNENPQATIFMTKTLL